MSVNHRALLGTVMIVDDQPGNLAFLSDALEAAGYRVLVATDGESALEQLRYVKPDVILLDAVMPGIDGFETCRRLKSSPDTRDLPILFMTALGDLDDLLRGFNEGAIDYIVKPIRHEEVLARVAAHMEQARAMQRTGHALVAGGIAALAINPEGYVTWITPTAAHWLADTECLQVNDRLPPSLMRGVMERMRAAAMPEPEGEEQLSFTLAGNRYAVTMAAVDQSNEYLLLLQKRNRDWDMEQVRGSLGLTLKEAEVLMWIARGKTNRDVGLILGCSPRTVNKHLENIFAKLGVETRGAAVAVAMDQLLKR